MTTLEDTVSPAVAHVAQHMLGELTSTAHQAGSHVKADEDLQNISHLCAAMLGRIGYQSCFARKQQRSTSGFEAVRKRILWKSRLIADGTKDAVRRRASLS